MEMSIPMMKKRRMTISEDIFEEKKKLDEESVYTVLRVSTKTSALDGRTTKMMRMKISDDIFYEKKNLDDESVYTVLRVSTKTSALYGRTTKKMTLCM